MPPVAATDLVGRFAGAETGRTAVGTPEAEAPPRPWVREDKGWLLVPFGTSVTYDLEVGPNAALLTANVSSRGSATGRLEVSWQPRDGEAVRVTPDLAAEPGRSVRLPPTGPQRGRLTLAAVATTVTDAQRAAMVLYAPRVDAGDRLPVPPPATPSPCRAPPT